jgi:hypothetical protein
LGAFIALAGLSGSGMMDLGPNKYSKTIFGHHPYKDLANFGYKPDMKYKS